MRRERERAIGILAVDQSSMFEENLQRMRDGEGQQIERSTVNFRKGRGQVG